MGLGIAEGSQAGSLKTGLVTTGLVLFLPLMLFIARSTHKDSKNILS